MNSNNGNGKPPIKLHEPTKKPRKRKKPTTKITVATGRKSRAKTEKGKAKPNKHATAAEVEDRTIQCMQMVIEGDSTQKVKAFFLQEHDIQWCQALKYLRLARERLRDENGLTEEFTLDDMKVQHYAMAMEVAHSESGEAAKDRLAALKHAGDIYGVQAPKKIAPTSPDGQTPYVQASLEALRTMTVEQLKLMSEVGKRRDALLDRYGSGGRN